MRQPKLTAEEQHELLRRSRLGDREARNALCQSLLPLAASLTRKLRADLQGADRDEAYTAAVEALERAVASYDPARGARLGTFVYATVVRTLKSFKPGGPIAVPKNAAYKHEARAARRTYGLWQVSEEVESPRQGELDEIERKEIKAMLKRLHPRDRAVMIATEVERRSLGEAAKHLGLSRSEVRVSRSRGIRALRQLLADYRPEKKSEISAGDDEK